LLRRFYLTIATVGYIGYIPYAPGTFGSLAGFLSVLLFKPSDVVLLFVIIIFLFIGAVSAENAERALGRDSPCIVVDEFCGYLLSIIFLPRVLFYLVMGFILFRFFDILKPLPIKRVEENLRGGFAVMMDDVVAGVYANIFLQLWMLLSQTIADHV